MQGQLNPKIVGATIIGFALIAGAYTVSNFGKPHQNSQPANVQATGPTQRVAIAVTDNDNNGIEDWRDEFITTAPVILEQASSTYIPPDTLTGKMSINFMENILSSRIYDAFGSTDEEIITNTVDDLGQQTEQKLYETSDIIIISDWDNQDIVNYANTAAITIQIHNVSNTYSELEIFGDYLRNDDESKLTELKTLAEAYQGFRDDTLKIPVPAFLAKEHLDLINTYEALYTDIKAMTMISSDPAVALLRLKRYQDDVTGLEYALQNMLLALVPHAELFTVNDPALLFAIFDPDYQSQ